MEVPPAVRQIWAEQRGRASEYFDIQEIEAVGPLFALLTWPEILRHSLWFHYIDNAGALSALVRGSSSVMETDRIVGFTWSLVSELQCWPWFDRVDAKSNPVDGLSRGGLSGPWDLVDLAAPDWSAILEPYA